MWFIAYITVIILDMIERVTAVSSLLVNIRFWLILVKQHLEILQPFVSYMHRKQGKYWNIWYFHSRHSSSSCGCFSATISITMTSSNVDIFRVTGSLCGEFTGHRSFDVFFDLRLNKRLSIQWRRRWFETPPRSFWRHCNDPWGNELRRINKVDLLH